MIFKLPFNFPSCISLCFKLVNFERPNIKGDHCHLLVRTSSKKTVSSNTSNPSKRTNKTRSHQKYLNKC